MKNYIFGYGSLIEKESRTRTTPEATCVFPVIIHNYERGWFARTKVPGLTTTFLGCIESSSSNNRVNGVIYRVTEKELEETDKREKHYIRTKIDLDKIENLSDIDLRDANVWLYLSQFKDKRQFIQSLPDKDFPIVQSYVDICVNGCVEIENTFPLAKERGFTKMFISETKYWNEYWANDRIYPRRPFIYRPNAYQIDQLLQDYLEDKSLFGKIYIE